MLLSCIVLSAIALASVTGDDLSFNRLANTDYVSCDRWTACPRGMVCNVYAPCEQGWCDDCVDPYIPGVTEALQFACTMPTTRLGESGCQEDGDCYDVASSCVQSTCICPDGMKPNPSGTACLMQNTLRLNATCDSNYQCGDKAQCGADRNGGVCVCYSNARPSPDGINCVTLKPGDQCSSVNCPTGTACPYATCASGNFTCQASYQWINVTQTGPMCVVQSATLNLAAGQSCSYNEPYNNICADGLICDTCPESVNSPRCANSRPTPVSATGSGSLMNSHVSVVSIVIATHSCL